MKKCRYCKSEIDSKAKICPQCGKSQKNPVAKTLGVILGIIIIIAGLSALASDLGGDEFNQIENGMTYDQVKEIIGCDGTVNSDTEVYGSKMTIYSWTDKIGIASANVTIENGVLVNKTQFGLK